VGPGDAPVDPGVGAPAALVGGRLGVVGQADGAAPVPVVQLGHQPQPVAVGQRGRREDDVEGRSERAGDLSRPLDGVGRAHRVRRRSQQLTHYVPHVRVGLDEQNVQASGLLGVVGQGQFSSGSTLTSAVRGERGRRNV
jgi:hypothetical protein